MTDYRRLKLNSDTYFFTVNLAERHEKHRLVDNIEHLRDAFRKVKHHHPFKIEAIVILPDHLHCIWTVPPGDAEFSKPWNLIKAGFSRTLPANEMHRKSRLKRGERGIWQRRFREHFIRDEEDLQHHIEYVHWNPVKHGWVKSVSEWPHSSFHSYVRRGVDARNGCGNQQM